MLGHEAGQYERIRFDSPSGVGSSSSRRVLVALLVVLISVSAVIGAAVALSTGQRGVAFAIGLVTVAFLSRVGC